MKKITRREMLKSISKGLVGTMFCVPSVLNAVDQGETVNGKPALIQVFYDDASRKNLKTDPVEFNGDFAELRLPEANQIKINSVQVIYSNGKKKNIDFPKDEDHVIQKDFMIKFDRKKNTVSVRMQDLEEEGLEKNPVLIRLSYIVPMEAKESIRKKGDLWDWDDKDYDWYIPKLAQGWRIVPSSLNVTKNVTGHCLLHEVGEPVLNSDGSMCIHMYVRARRRHHATLYATVKYDIVYDELHEVTGDQIYPFPDGPYGKYNQYSSYSTSSSSYAEFADKQIRIKSAQLIYASGKKVNIDFKDDGYAIQNGLVFFANQKEKTVTVRILEEE